MIIGLCGYKGSGKTTIAKAALDSMSMDDWQHIGFSDPIIEMLEALGISRLSLDAKSAWDVPQPILCGKTIRHAAQTLGTEWGRNCIGPELWLNRAITRAKGAKHTIIDNVRFPNEADAIRQTGGLVIRFKRPDMETPIDPHPSEQFIDRIYCESTFVNVRSVANAAASFRNLITELTRNA